MAPQNHAAAEIAAADHAAITKMKKQLKYGAAVLFIIALAGYIGTQQTMNNDAVISAKEVRTQLSNDTTIVLLDVRTAKEHSDERIGNTPFIPLQELQQRIHELDPYKDRTIIVYCRSGNRSGSAVKILREQGFNALNMLGGIIQWKAEKFPTISGPIQ